MLSVAALFMLQCYLFIAAAKMVRGIKSPAAVRRLLPHISGKTSQPRCNLREQLDHRLDKRATEADFRSFMAG
jgi:hypothetical protein